MCQFKSGVILKSKVVIAPGENDSHSDLLETLGIRDDYLNATRTFVRAELIPEGGEWWVSPEEHPEEWKFVVDQDITPDWFDQDESEKVFREAVCAWWKEHVLVDQKIDELNSGFYRLKRCEVKKLCNDVRVLLDSSTVGKMLGSSTVGKMLGSSTVGEMWDSSTVGKMLGSSTVGKMWDSSTVGKMLGSSTVREMLGSSTVGEMWDSSTVGKMLGSSTVGKMWDSSTVGKMLGSSTVGKMLGSSTVGKMWGSSTVGKMWDSSTVREMLGSSTVGEMRGSSTARDFKNYPNVKIFIPENENFEMVVHKAEKE